EFTTRYKYEYDRGSSSEINGGTAFVISSHDEKTYLLTCAHCVNEQILEGGITLSLGDEVYEAADSEAAVTYANIVACAKGNEGSEKVQALLKAMQTDEVKAFIDEKYAGAVKAIF
ncbi:MAG: MetQ/NlpA family ABC transporter substrate-binding protein, partial [Mogibacterium sp.]|nr:MetQ/NlpA family ABC transporter substrate-binding protein [Mogibacterium sp.]